MRTTNIESFTLSSIVLVKISKVVYITRLYNTKCNMAQRSRSGSPSYLFKFDDRFATLRDPSDEIRRSGTVVVLASLSHEIVDRNDARHFPGLDDRSV